MAKARTPRSLTVRMHQALLCLAAGLSMEQTAERLGIRGVTVRTILHRARSSTGEPSSWRLMWQYGYRWAAAGAGPLVLDKDRKRGALQGPTIPKEVFEAWQV